jgi:hypothetical protein
MYKSTLSSISALDVGGWSTPRPSHFTSREILGTRCIGGWVGHRAGLDGCGKSRSHRNSIPGPSSPYGVAIPTELSRPILYLRWELVISVYFEMDGIWTDSVVRMLVLPSSALAGLSFFLHLQQISDLFVVTQFRYIWRVK